MSAIITNITARLQAHTELTAVTQKQFDAWDPKRKKAYLAEHPNSKFAGAARQQYVPRKTKMSDVYRESNDFSDETNRKARDKAREAVDKENADRQEILKRNREARKIAPTGNAPGSSESKAAGKLLRQKVDPKKVADQFFTQFNKKHDPAATMDKLQKSPAATKNFLGSLIRSMGNRPNGVSPEQWKGLRKQITDAYHSKDPRKYLPDLFGG